MNTPETIQELPLDPSQDNLDDLLTEETPPLEPEEMSRLEMIHRSTMGLISPAQNSTMRWKRTVTKMKRTTTTA
jgi:hypothetical protein